MYGVVWKFSEFRNVKQQRKVKIFMYSHIHERNKLLHLIFCDILMKVMLS